MAAVAAPNLILSGCSKVDEVDRDLQFKNMDQGYDEAVRLSRIESLVTDTAFSLPQTLVHCAQSIEFSMLGFPEPKSALFQKTVGSVAFNIFSRRGRMTHDLSEAIPGAHPLNPGITVEQALERLRNAIDTFRQSDVVLKPHFAYGALNKNQYELAHAMHLADHFSAIGG